MAGLYEAHKNKKQSVDDKPISTAVNEIADYNKPVAIGDLVVDEYGIPGMVIAHSPAYPHALDYVVEWYDGEDEPDSHRTSEEKIKQWRAAAKRLKESLKERVP